MAGGGEIAVGWVDRAANAKGLDHLGSVAPCIAIYSALLPGMTNVTDRARYYSFYPWFLWSYEQSGEPLESARFHELFRRADCLFTLIAEYHGTVSTDSSASHGGAMVGGRKLIPALAGLHHNKALSLSEFSTQEANGSRYFQNRLGGLGQYYLGTLEGLGVLTGRNGDFVQYDPVLGPEIAKRFDSGVPAKKFWSTLSRDTVTTTTLTSLAAFCPCQLSNNVPEHSWLADLFFGRSPSDDVDADRRRRSLGLILHLTREIASDPDAAIDVNTFRNSCYSRSLPNGKPWNLPDNLSEARDHWRLYVRNELLSVSVQALLSVFVRALELMPLAPRSPNEVTKSLLAAPSLRRIAKHSWEQFLDDWAKILPDQSHLLHVSHELRLIDHLLGVDTAASSWTELSGVAKGVLSVLAALVLRTDSAQPPYGSLPVTQAFLADYPINLAAFTQNIALWQDMDIRGVVEWLVREWTCEAHLRIALRKLRIEHNDTFTFYPTEAGLMPRQVPPFAHSNPRVRNALQILRDIGALRADTNGRLQITENGSGWLEEVCQS